MVCLKDNFVPSVCDICCSSAFVTLSNTLLCIIFSTTQTLTKNCARTSSCVPRLSFRSKWDWKNKQKPESSCSSQTFTELTPKLECNTKLTRRSRCFYLRMNSRGRCTVVPDAGISFCYQRTQTVC